MNYFFGFSRWKHQFMLPFLEDMEKDSIVFINPILKQNYFDLAINRGLSKDSSIYIWGKKSFPNIEKFAQQHQLKLYRVEDGFIRSIGLGSDLTQPYSLVIDSRGIYFDSTKESDLEYIVNNTDFNEKLLTRAKNIQKYLKEKKLSKYNLFENKVLNIPKNKKIILIPGQVENDASLKYGAPDMDNLKLLKKTRQNSSDAYIIYKPHPDVLVGNRIGNIEENIILKYADKIVTEVGLESVLDICDEVYTMTSLVGFEALMRDKKVYTYGKPFYAGWGLTNDLYTQERRTKTLNLDELIAATLICYPLYINPFTLKICEIEEFLEALEKERELHKSSIIYRIKNKLFNFINRKLQLFLRIITFKL